MMEAKCEPECRFAVAYTLEALDIIKLPILEGIDRRHERWRMWIEMKYGIDADFIYQAGPLFIKQFGEYEGINAFLQTFIYCDAPCCPGVYIDEMTDTTKCDLYGELTPPLAPSDVEDDPSDLPF